MCGAPDGWMPEKIRGRGAGAATHFQVESGLAVRVGALGPWPPPKANDGYRMAVVGAMTYDHGDSLRVYGRSGAEHTFYDREAGDAVQDLGDLRLHPRPLAGRENDHVNLV